MSTATTAVTVDAGQDRPAHAADVGDRGSLHVADRVVERVAGYAVTLIDGAGAAPRRVLGIGGGERDAGDQPNVTATVYGDTATVSATIAVQWPASVRAVAGQVRDRIREEVARTTDVRVAQVDIDVVSMDPPDRAGPRVR